MGERRNRAGLAWTIHGIALALWAALYFVLCWDALFPAEKPALDLAGFGAVIVGMMLLGYASVTTLVMVFLGRWPLVPVVMHAGTFAVWAASAYYEQQEDRARAEEHAREEARRTKERQPEGCLHVRKLRVKGGKPRHVEVTFASACDDVVSVGDVTVIGFDGAGGNDIIDRWREPPTRVLGEMPATVAFDGDDMQGGDPTIPLTRWGWRINVDAVSRSSQMLCFASPGAPDSRRCEALEAVEVVE